MLDDYPMRMEPWKTYQSQPDFMIDKLKQPHRQQYSMFPTPQVTPARQVAPIEDWPCILSDYLNGKLWCGEISQEKQFQDPKYEKCWPDTPPRRVCRSNHKPYGFDERTGIKSWTRLFSWRDNPDFGVCVWDDRRLEQWGYVIPEFESEDDTRLADRNRNFYQLELKWSFSTEGDLILKNQEP
ncbi:hypothetical protein ABW20_dc0108247 [Dactylellina cionopaga]|nr:hypothetical protein ABW20_dc0108247 [Dactylellina cionopaga]